MILFFRIFVTGCAISKMTNNNADQANHKDSNKEKEKKHDSGEIILLSKGSNRHFKLFMWRHLVVDFSTEVTPNDRI